MINRHPQPVFVSLLWILCVSFFSPGISHAQKFVHAYSSISALNATFWIIQDAGFAKQEGLETELVYIPSSSTVAQATLAGEVMIWVRHVWLHRRLRESGDPYAVSLVVLRGGSRR